MTKAIIGDNTVIREYATINRGTKYHVQTVIGKNCFIMAYAHVAHDCIIGNNVIMANSVNLAGHVEVDDFAILGGVLPVHQFVKIGAHCMVGGGFRVQQDICPYALVGGYPLKVVGINSIGLRRRGFAGRRHQAVGEDVQDPLLLRPEYDAGGGADQERDRDRLRDRECAELSQSLESRHSKIAGCS